MVKQQKAPVDSVHIPVTGRLTKRIRRKRPPPYAQVLRMLSQEQSEGEPAGTPDPSGCKDDGIVAGSSAGASGGAVTPGGCVNGKAIQEFLSTGRTGRRNAMPDIGQHADTGTADLPERLEALTTDPGGTSGSRSGPSDSSSSSQQQEQRAG